ncbi:MAG: hypothetical protein WCQ89_05305 [Verrucomicrobiota bacterium]
MLSLLSSLNLLTIVHSAPDTGLTALLLCVGLASVAAAARFFKK